MPAPIWWLPVRSISAIDVVVSADPGVGVTTRSGVGVLPPLVVGVLPPLVVGVLSPLGVGVGVGVSACA